MKFKLQIQTSSNSFGDQFVTVYVIGAEGTEMINFHNHEGSWMNREQIIKRACREAGISLKAVQGE